jgi:peptide/nickel transport system substrate-binding protein
LNSLFPAIRWLAGQSTLTLRNKSAVGPTWIAMALFLVSCCFAVTLEAASRKDTLVIISGAGVNSMDIHRTGTNRPSYQVAVNMYDRLVTFGIKPEGNGGYKYDSTSIKPELATHWELVNDGSAYIFHLRKEATFWDGSPVTAADVKWSFDRAVSLGGFPGVQMKAGGMTSTDQFEVVDDHTFKVKMTSPSKLTLPDLAVPVPIIINSKVAKSKATKDDPWATEYLHKNPAGGGAYMLERWDPGQQLVYKRFDNWKNGPLPAMKRVIVREVPSAATRRALIERGDADVALGLPNKDSKELAKAGKLTVVSTTIDNSMYAVGLNVEFKPFADKRVRQAIAWALPYQQIFEAAAYGLGKKMWGGVSMTPETIEWPQPYPYDTNIGKAKNLLAEAGYGDGFEVPISINLGFAQWTEPTALLIQESLAKIGIKTTINKIPGASWRTKALVEKGLELHLKNFGGWLNYPDYYFYWVYVKGHLFNSMNYHNEELEKLVEVSLPMALDHPDYQPNIKRLMAIGFEEVPLIPIWQPTLEVAMSPGVEGFVNWFHRQLDIRAFTKK